MLDHGTPSMYNRGCRCEDCRECNRQRGSRVRAQLATRLAEDPTAVQHGTITAYSNWSCRCQECRDVWSVRMRSTEYKIIAARSRAKRAAVPPG